MKRTAFYLRYGKPIHFEKVKGYTESFPIEGYGLFTVCYWYDKHKRIWNSIDPGTGLKLTYAKTLPDCQVKTYDVSDAILKCIRDKWYKDYVSDLEQWLETNEKITPLPF